MDRSVVLVAAQLVGNDDDCADDDATVHPGAATSEPDLCTIDRDGDGYGYADASDTRPGADNGSDCDDEDADVFPGAASGEPELCTIDGDGDGYGDASPENPNADPGTDCVDDDTSLPPLVRWNSTVLSSTTLTDMLS